MRRSPLVSILFSTALAASLSTVTATAQETILKNDGFVDGQSVGFQGGFVIGEIAGSRLTPIGTPPWRINRVQFLFGSVPTTETITLRIYDDAAGTDTPGGVIFSGDYEVTGSSTVMHEVNLVAENILVTGQFRVGIEFQHDGQPSIARDGDGNIQVTRNFIFAEGLGWARSSLFGLTGDWVIRAGVQAATGGGPGEANIISVADVGNDQGKQVRIRFDRSGQDEAGAATPILNYEVLRRVDQLPIAPVPGVLLHTDLSLAGLRSPSAVLMDGWDYVTSVPAHGDDIYSVVVPTLADSSISQGLHWSVFLVRATTAAPLTFFDSAPDSGYSVDNLPPAPPAPFTAAYGGGATHLMWDPNGEDDFWYYRLHRGTSESFVPGPGNLIATASQPGFDDVGPAGGYYKLAAVDVNGNVSGFALVTPENTAGVDDHAALVFGLANAGPNPSRDGRVALRVSLPSGAPARIEVLDVGGRRVAEKEVGSLGAGRHTVDVSAGGLLAPGIYVVRLSQGDDERRLRIVVTR